MENVKVERKGIGFTGLLTLIFITLKLCGVITWSWVWVLAPLWIGCPRCVDRRQMGVVK